MILHIVMLVGGLVLILLGANFLTDGASSVAKRWGVSELVIGLTIVAFGTSAPELAISVLSSLQGNAELAVGNVVGSNIFNILVIVGVSALVFPLKVGRGIMLNEVPFCSLPFLCGTHFQLQKTPGHKPVLMLSLLRNCLFGVRRYIYLAAWGR